MTTSMAEFGSRIIEVALQQIDTAYTAEVQRYDSATQTVEVQILNADRYRDPDDEVQYVEHPVLGGVPVAFPTTGDFGITWPITRGDRGLLIIRTNSHDEVDSGNTNAPVEPRSGRRHDLSDAVFLPSHGLPGDPLQPKDVSNTDTILRLPAGAKLKVNNGSIPVSRSDITDQRFDALAARVAALETHAGAHVHPVTGANTGPVVPGTSPTGTDSGTSTASNQLDVES